MRLMNRLFTFPIRVLLIVASSLFVMTYEGYGKERITITFAGNTANVDLGNVSSDDINFTIDGAHVSLTNTNKSEEMEFELKGTSTDGSFTYNGEFRSQILLNNLNLTSTRGAALDIKDGKRIDLILVDGTKNTLVDAEDGNQNAALYCKGHLEVSGSGTLDVTGNTRHAIATKEYMLLKKSTGTITIKHAARDAIHAGQYFQMNGGTLNLSGMGDDGIQVEVTKDKSDLRNGQIFIHGGTINIDIESDDGKGIQSDSLIVITGGTFVIYARGAGSKGISSGTDMIINPIESTINMTITASGGVYEDPETDDTSKCMGIKVTKDLAITGGNITISNYGKKSKGIKVHGTYYASGGTVTANVDAAATRKTALSIRMAMNYSRVYGDANPTFQYTMGGNMYYSSDLFCEATKTSPAGEYPIIFKGQSTSNIGSVNGILNVKRAPLSIKAKNYTIKQGEPLPSFELEYSGFKNGESNMHLTKQPEIICSATSDSAPGTYDIKVCGAESDNYEISYISGTLTIGNPSKITVVAKNYTRFYGDINPKFEYTVEGGVFEGEPEIICEATKASPVGEYPIKIMRGTVRNTNCTYVNGTLTITPAPVIAFVNDAERLYGQEKPDFYVTYAGLKNSEKQLTFTEPPVFHTDATKTSEVGKYSVTLSGKAKNYVIAEVDPGTLTIKPAPLTIKANDVSRLYYAPNPSTYYFSYSGFVNSENEQVLTQKPSVKTDATQTSDVGKYVLLPENAKAKNYDISYSPGVLTINKRSLKATVNDARREYGEENPNFSISYSGFVNNENESVLTQKPTISVNASRSSNVGSYLVSVSGGSSKNYEINCENGVLVVEKAPLTARVDDASKIYGQDNPAFTITYEGLKNGEKSPKWEKALEFKTVATAESGVGQHYISASGIPVNYNLKIVESGILTITPAPLTIKAKGASRMYYEDDPDFSFTCSGFVNSDNESVLTKNPTYTTDATKTSNVGKYSITPSGAAAKNYDISYEQGELTITKRPLKATSHCSREYGEENPQFALEYDGFVNDEDENVINVKPKATTAATRKSNVGEYPITLEGGEAMNYEISCIPGTLTVTKAPLTVKVNDETKVYGAQNPSFSLSFEGLKNDETVPVWTSRPTIQTEATRYSDVGQYNIKASEGVAVNYETQMLDGILDIMPAQLTIRANDASRLYYDEEPSFSYTCYGFVNGDGENALSAKPTLTTNATKTSNAGEYDIMPSGADSHNYAISYTKGTLRVLPRTLTASVGDYERIYNEENPAFTVTYDGFVGNEDERVLTTKPTAKTAATKTSDVGTYRIDVAGGEAKNYGFSYVPGRLTINKAEQSIVWNQDFRGLRVGDQVELKATASSGLKVTYSMESSQPAEIYTAGTTYWLDCKAEGETQIVAVQEGNRNYYATNRIRKPLIVGPVAIVEAEDGSLVKIQSTQLGIRVTDAKLGENIRIYTIDGMLQRSVRVEEPTTYIQMKRNNIYIVRVGEKVVKLKH